MTLKTAKDIKPGDVLTKIGVLTVPNDSVDHDELTVVSVESFYLDGEEYVRVHFPSDVHIILQQHWRVRTKEEQAYYYTNKGVIVDTWPVAFDSGLLFSSDLVITKAGEVVKNRRGPTGRIQ